MKNININIQATIVLTEFGMQILHLYSTHEYQKSLHNQNKFTTSLWEIMSIFGVHLYNGAVDLPFENNEIIFEE